MAQAAAKAPIVSAVSSCPCPHCCPSCSSLWTLDFHPTCSWISPVFSAVVDSACCGPWWSDLRTGWAPWCSPGWASLFRFPAGLWAAWGYLDLCSFPCQPPCQGIRCSCHVPHGPTWRSCSSWFVGWCSGGQSPWGRHWWVCFDHRFCSLLELNLPLCTPRVLFPSSTLNKTKFGLILALVSIQVTKCPRPPSLLICVTSSKRLSPFGRVCGTNMLLCRTHNGMISSVLRPPSSVPWRHHNLPSRPVHDQLCPSLSVAQNGPVRHWTWWSGSCWFVGPFGHWFGFASPDFWSCGPFWHLAPADLEWVRSITCQKLWPTGRRSLSTNHCFLGLVSHLEFCCCTSLVGSAVCGCGSFPLWECSWLQWRFVLEQVEAAHRDNVPICGFSADIVKAFNVLPRRPAFAAAKLLGIAQPTLVALAGALSGFKRHFVIRGSYSPGVDSGNGFPEGCAYMSCVSMMILTQLFHRWLSCCNALFRPVSYVHH